jgi:hypothetical protein
VLTAPFVLGNRDELMSMFAAASVDSVAIELRDGSITFPSVEVFVETEVKGSPLEALLDEESYRGLMDEAGEQLGPFRREDGAVTMPMDAFVITGVKSPGAEADHPA